MTKDGPHLAGQRACEGDHRAIPHEKSDQRCAKPAPEASGLTGRSNNRSRLRCTGTDPWTVQTDATARVEPIPVDAERLPFDGDTRQDDEPHPGDGVHGFSGGLRWPWFLDHATADPVSGEQ